jgi:hypothetical protein
MMEHLTSLALQIKRDLFPQLQFPQTPDITQTHACSER